MFFGAAKKALTQLVVERNPLIPNCYNVLLCFLSR